METQKGQALLLVLLAMAVLATISLSVASRSISEVAVTTREEESLRAFSAAEAGVEEGLITASQQEIATAATPIPIERELTTTAPTGESTVSTFTAEIDRYPTDLTKFAYPVELLSGQSGTVSFVTRDENGSVLSCSGSAPCFSGSSLTLCWGKQGGLESLTTAVITNIIYRDGAGDYALATIGFDPVSTRRDVGTPPVAPNNFEAPSAGGCTIAGQDYVHRANIDFATLGVIGTPIMMRVAPLYNTTEPQLFGVSTAGNLPIQGRRVSSEGRAGEISRRINAYLLNPEIPFIFDTALYSSSAITK